MRVIARSVVPLCILLAACDPDPASEEDSDGPGPVARDCALETRADEYTLGMIRAGDRVQVAMLDAMPAPPSRGDNTWRVRVQDESGAAMSGAIVEVSSFMPDHQHGSSIVTHVQPTEAPGELVLDPVNFFMPGLWEVTLDLQLDDGSEDAVVFRFCVDP